MLPRSAPARYSFIVNPVSGRGRFGRAMQRARRRLEQAGHHVAVQLTRDRGHALEIAAQIPQGVSAVVAVGGDGTVREVAEGILGRGIPLAILPVGTENLAARQLGFKPSAARLLQALLGGAVRYIDVGRVGQRVFIVVGGVGFDAEVVQRLTEWRSGNITRLDYVTPIWRTFWGHRFPRLQVEADGRQVYSGAGLALVGNLPRYGGGLRILNAASCNDGKLDLCIFPCHRKFKLLRHAAVTLCRCHQRIGDAIYVKAMSIQIASDGQVPLQLDGDACGHLPAHFSVRPGALGVLLPQPQPDPGSCSKYP